MHRPQSSGMVTPLKVHKFVDISICTYTRMNLYTYAMQIHGAFVIVNIP